MIAIIVAASSCPVSVVILLGWIFARIGLIKRFHVWVALGCYRKMKENRLGAIEEQIAAKRRKLDDASAGIGSGKWKCNRARRSRRKDSSNQETSEARAAGDTA
ncbi:unnamed protein product [Microthlaspi erraticum]|uniref:Uncharacterized protein n=1 Tax=Microthlaspi erraticum TaxID=1685480 RepID=A0A6D2LCS5_9BRAS|nr:unnamed protein product [Microthlaspi erraticum]CAA7049609.1 unnamed protein product [Microthlaspi erraticum]CAA7062136.1 unnamed protein product [Microthlaspi erraticum]